MGITKTSEPSLVCSRCGWPMTVEEDFGSGKKSTEDCLRETLIRDRQAKGVCLAAPVQSARCARRERSWETVAIFGKLIGVRGSALGSDREIELDVGIAGHADFFANEPVGRGGKFHGTPGDFGRRRERNDEQDLVVITVNLDVSWLVQLKRNRPLDRAGFPTGRQVPFDLGRDTGVARVLPVGVPAGRHFQQQPGAERLAGNNRRGVGDELCVDQLAALKLLTTHGGRGKKRGQRRARRRQMNAGKPSD